MAKASMNGNERLRLAVVTTSRADFGIYQPVLAELSSSPKLEVGLIASGMHLSADFGLTIEEVRKSPYPIWAEAACIRPQDDPVSIALSCGDAVQGIAQGLARANPDMVMVLGDRYEMMGAALAAHILTIPIAHLHGGEETVGALDNGFRHAISKLSHLHFTATSLAARRLIQMGERPERVICSGAPALDAFRQVPVVDRAEFLKRTGLADAPFLLVTYHPETLALARLDADFDALWRALQETNLQLLLTAANADAQGRRLNGMIAERSKAHGRAILVESMGHLLYPSAMRHAKAMVGNSSSGIIEAAHFSLPVVNVGDRQKGRERSGNVIDCAAEFESIRDALARARSQEFRASLAGKGNVYGDGNAAPRIRRALEAIGPHRGLLAKPFHMLA